MAAGYVAMKKREIYHKPDGYLPLEHPPGEAQVDFGDAAFYENGQLYHGKYLDLSFPYSNHGYLSCSREKTRNACSKGSLIAIFEHMGGVPPRVCLLLSVIASQLPHNHRYRTDKHEVLKKNEKRHDR